MTIDEKYPTKLDRNNMKSTEWVKARTLELYSYLPQTTLEERATYKDIRDEVIRLNYKFFHYVAKNTFVSNTAIDDEDKFQSAILHFCKIWPKYQFASQYRTDLSFAVFFKPRLSEEIQRELTTVKYSIERQLKMEAGKQLNKHWAKVEYDDLKDVDLPAQKLQSLKSIFGCMYWADLEVHELYIQSDADTHLDSFEQLYSDQYDSVIDLLIHEMIEEESLLDDKTLLRIAEVNSIPFETLREARPEAEEELHRRLVEMKDISDGFKH